MTITPFVDLKSEDILSAHISGLQHAINKIETTLNEKQTAVTGHALVAVTDQADINLHNLIYEGTVRNWLSTPAPVVKRNGTVVDASEYKIEPAYGVVVFYAQQNPSDAITADITYVSGGSSVIDGMNQSISDNATNIAANAATLAGLQAFGLMTKHYVGQYRSHGLSTMGNATGITVLNNTIDIFPFRVYEDMVVDDMGILVTTAVTGSLVAMAIYSDNNGYPGTLIAQTGQIDTGTTGWKEGPVGNGAVSLTAGLYWIGRWNNTNGGSPAFAGLVASALNPIPSAPTYATAVPTYATGEGGAGVGGIRWTKTWTTNFPTTMDAIGSGAAWLDRTAYASPWVRRKS